MIYFSMMRRGYFLFLSLASLACISAIIITTSIYWRKSAARQSKLVPANGIHMTATANSRLGHAFSKT
jgi:hypothetical protein